MNNQTVPPFHRRQDKNPFKNDDAERLIRARVQDSKNVVVTEHAEERLEERGITTLDLFLILKTGYVLKQPVANTKGDWEVIVEKRLRGRRDAGVVTIILTHEAKLIVKTVQWPMKYHYTGCGLDYIYLLNGFERHDTAYGQGVSIGDIDALHSVIALDIIARPQKIRGQELRFLRTMLDLSQDGLAAFLGVDRATIADWEKERGQAD